MDVISILRDHGIHIGTVKKGGGGLGNAYANAYTLPTTVENQKTWDVPVDVYDAETDTMVLYHNTGILDKASWTLTGEAATGYKVTIPNNPETAIEDNNVIIVVLRNLPPLPDGENISGTRLTPGSVGMSKLGQDVQDKINNAGSNIEIVNNFTTGGADKAASAETVKILKTNQDTIKQKADNSLQMGKQNNNDSFNLGNVQAERTFMVNQSDWKSLTNVETLMLSIPVGSFSGLIRVTYTSYWGQYDEASGGATVLYRIGKYGNEVKLNDFVLETITPKFAEHYKVDVAAVNDTIINISLHKGAKAYNPLLVKVELQGYSSPYKTAYELLKSAYATTIDSGSPTSFGYPWPPQTSRIPTGAQINFWDKSQWADCVDGRNYLIDGVRTNLATLSPLQWHNFLYGFLPQGMGNFKAFLVASDLGLENAFTYGVLKTIKPWKDMSGGELSQEFTIPTETYRRYAVGTPIEQATWSPWVCIQSKDVDVKQLFTSVSNGKTALASAISDSGVYTSPVETFPNMANNIRLIPKGVPYYEIAVSGNTGQAQFTTSTGSAILGNYNYIEVSFPFRPQLIHVRSVRTGDYFTESIFTSFADGYSLDTIKMAQYNSSQYSNISTFNFRPLITQSGSNWIFRIPVMYYNSTFVVRAYGSS